MRAYHNDEAIKAKYIARVQAHYDADEIIKGQYWEDGKGCAIGCTLHSNDHLAYETELGIPRVLARLEDGIFEGLPNDVAKEFPLRFLNAVKVGSDLSGVFPRFMHWLLVDDKHGIIKYAKNKGVIQDVANLYQRKINGEEIDGNDWLVVRNAADAAYDAADAAAADDDADAAAYAAAAYAAADDADAAAAADAAREIQADKLVELIEDAR